MSAHLLRFFAPFTLAACSFAFVDPLRSDTTPRRFEPVSPCTRSRAAPVADLAIAAGFTALTVGALIAEQDIDPHGDEGPPGPHPLIPLGTLVVGGAVVTPFAVSGVWGMSAVDRCRASGPGPRDEGRRDGLPMSSGYTEVDLQRPEPL